MADRFSGAHYVDASRSNFTSVGRDQHNIHNTYIGTQDSVLKDLQEALHPVECGGDIPNCLEGTREELLKKIDTWLNDFDAPNILWITGSPGVGKSTIASTLVSRLWRQERLASSFFFKREVVSRSDPRALWRTVAFHLSQFDPVFASELAALLKKRRNPCESDIQLHFEELIRNFLTECDSALVEKHPVIILDALDECGCEETQAAHRKILLDTIIKWSSFPLTVKLIVTGRNDRIFQPLRNVCQVVELGTGDLVNEDANNDIRKFFTKRFGEIAVAYSSLSQSWPESSTIEKLTLQASGLFIWAETVMKFMEQGSPDDQLKHILAGNFRNQGNAIDTLYLHILEISFKGCDASVLRIFQAVVGSIILTKSPLHRDDLNYYIGGDAKEDSIDFILHRLSAALWIGKDDRLIHVCHLSFAEFLCDQERCPERFSINRNARNERLASGFAILKDRIREYNTQAETSKSFIHLMVFWKGPKRNLMETLQKDIVECQKPQNLLWSEIHAIYVALSASEKVATEGIVSASNAFKLYDDVLKCDGSNGSLVDELAEMAATSKRVLASSQSMSQQFRNVRINLFQIMKDILSIVNSMNPERSGDVRTSGSNSPPRYSRLQESSACLKEILVLVNWFSDQWLETSTILQYLESRSSMVKVTGTRLRARSLRDGWDKAKQRFLGYMTKIGPARNYCRSFSPSQSETATRPAVATLVEVWGDGVFS